MSKFSSPVRSTSDDQIQSSLPSTAGVVQERKSQRAQPRVRRRNRIISSCLECRRRKLKCDKEQPCTNCVKASRQCLFISPSYDAAAQARLAEVKEKMGILERSLEEQVTQQKQAHVDSSSPINESESILVQEEAYSGDEEDTKHLKSSDFVTEDAAYYEDEEGDNDTVDIGVALGKLRITERIGGLVRPRFSDEVSLQVPSVDVANTLHPAWTSTEGAPQKRKQLRYALDGCRGLDDAV